jgi:hypothetical protein
VSRERLERLLARDHALTAELHLVGTSELLERLQRALDRGELTTGEMIHLTENVATPTPAEHVTEKPAGKPLAAFPDKWAVVGAFLRIVGQLERGLVAHRRDYDSSGAWGAFSAIVPVEDVEMLLAVVDGAQEAFANQRREQEAGPRGGYLIATGAPDDELSASWGVRAVFAAERAGVQREKIVAFLKSMSACDWEHAAVALAEFTPAPAPTTEGT